MNRATFAVAIIFIPILALMAAQPRPTPHRSGWHAIDGDTVIAPNGEHIRLLGIDTPEMPGHCRPGRQCVPGDPYAAQEALQHALDTANVFCIGAAHDVYRRRLAECFTYAGNRSASINEWMLARGYAQPYRRSR